MLYVVGDSNAVATSKFILRTTMVIDDTSFCLKGWKTDDVLEALQRTRSSHENVRMMFLFVGHNDDLGGGALFQRIHAIVAWFRRMNPMVVVMVAVPFCVPGALDQTRCTARRDVARLLQDGVRDATIITSHLARDGDLKKNLRTRKKASTQWDSLHMNDIGYRKVAEVVNHKLNVVPARGGRRAVQSPKRLIY